MRKVTLLIILVATAAVAFPQQMPMTKPSGPHSDAQKIRNQVLLFVIFRVI